MPEAFLKLDEEKKFSQLKMGDIFRTVKTATVRGQPTKFINEFFMKVDQEELDEYGLNLEAGSFRSFDGEDNVFLVSSSLILTP